LRVNSAVTRVNCQIQYDWLDKTHIPDKCPLTPPQPLPKQGWGRQLVVFDWPDKYCRTRLNRWKYKYCACKKIGALRAHTFGVGEMGDAYVWSGPDESTCHILWLCVQWCWSLVTAGMKNFQVLVAPSPWGRGGFDPLDTFHWFWCVTGTVLNLVALLKYHLLPNCCVKFFDPLVPCDL